MTDHANATMSGGARRRRRLAVLMTLLVMAAVAAVFAPALEGEFIYYDTEWFVGDNPRILEGLSGANFVYAWTTREMGYPKPLSILSWMLDAELYGAEPWGFKLTNLLLHAIASGLLFGVLCVSTGSPWRSLLVVGLWAVHPLRVEPVAWVASRKDVLAACFGFAAWLAYVQAAGGRGGAGQTRARLRPGWYAGALTLFACSLLSKPLFVTLPVLLLLWDAWPLARFSAGRRVRVVLEKLPFAALAAGLAVWVLVAREASGGVSAPPWADRVIHALLAYGRYLAKMVDFSALAIPYPHRAWSAAAWLGAAAGLGGVCVLVFLLRRRAPWLAVGWVWFLVAMGPMLGLVAFSDFAMADRFAYLPAIGITVALVWSLPAPRRRDARMAGAVAALIVVGGLAGFSRAQLAHWRNSETLFRHTIAVTRPQPHPAALKNLMAYYWERRDAFFGQGAREDLGEVLDFYARALEQEPDWLLHRSMHARLLLRAGRAEAAEAALGRAYRAALAEAPDPARIPDLNGVGQALMEAGARRRAEVIYRRALSVAGSSQAWGPLSVLAHGLARLGDLGEARALCRRVLAQRSLNPKWLNNCAGVESEAEDHAAAAARYRRALELHPDEVVYRFNLGRALRRAGAFEAARGHLRDVVRRRPRMADAHLELAGAAQALGDLEAARRHYLRVIELGGRVADACNNLGAMAARQGDLGRAGAWFRRALEADPEHAGARRNMARLESILRAAPEKR